MDDGVEMGRQGLADALRQSERIDIGTEVQPRTAIRCGLIDIAAMFKSFYHGITCFL